MAGECKKNVRPMPRPRLGWADRLYLTAAVDGLRVTLRHFFRRKVTVEYPEEPWVAPLGYRGAPYLVRDQEGRIKCVACQLCEFVCPSRAIRVIPPGPDGQQPDRPCAEKMPAEFRINLLRCIFCGLCQEVCPEEAIFLQKDHIFVVGAKSELVFSLDQLLARGGRHAGYKKWDQIHLERLEQEKGLARPSGANALGRGPERDCGRAPDASNP